MLSSSRVEAIIPAADLKRARDFYANVLGLTPERETDGLELTYRTGGSAFLVYETAYAGQAGHTIAQWQVDDVAAEVRDLEAKGVVFEVYDLPGARWDGPIAAMEGMGRAAWFKDSEGNILALVEEDDAA